MSNMQVQSAAALETFEGTMRTRIVLAIIFSFLLSQASFASADGIGWIPTWKQACSDAAKMGKPILLVSAAPACGGVPGIW